MAHNPGEFAAFKRFQDFAPTRYFAIYDFDPLETDIISEALGGGTAAIANQNVGGGVRRYTTGTTNGQYAQAYVIADVGRPADNAVFEWRVRVAPTGTLTGNRCLLQATDVNQAGLDSAYFDFDQSVSANWLAGSTSDAVSYTITTTSVVVVANTWVTLRIETSTANVKYYIDGVLVATHTTNIPTSTVALGLYNYQDKVSSTGAKSHDIDFMRVGTTRLA